eukprot:GHRQ01030246.1.p1 GENE.GHRQ01030246.1~~GHRQ01030246.1.p1  ORF type:complete len:169 (+),score=19.97 GHRQ01030246.1:120-626(+)
MQSRLSQHDRPNTVHTARLIHCVLVQYKDPMHTSSSEQFNTALAQPARAADLLNPKRYNVHTTEAVTQAVPLTSTRARAYSTSGCFTHLSRNAVSRRMPVLLALMLYSAICEHDQTAAVTAAATDHATICFALLACGGAVSHSKLPMLSCSPTSMCVADQRCLHAGPL